MDTLFDTESSVPIIAESVNGEDHQCGNNQSYTKEANGKELSHTDDVRATDLEQHKLLTQRDVIETQPLKSTNADPPFYSSTTEADSTLSQFAEEDEIKKIENNVSTDGKRTVKDSDKMSSGWCECCSCITQNTGDFCDCLAAICCCMCLLK